MVSIMSLLVEGLKKYVPKSAKHLIFSLIFFEVDSSFIIERKVFKLSMLIIHIEMQGTLSQICYLCPSFCFM